MELRHLRSFVAVAELRSFSRAAERIHLSQPALSRQIALLEHDLGVRVFDRTDRRVRLTSEGEDLLERSRGLVMDAASLAERARALKGGQTGILRVGSTPQTLESFLAPFLARYRKLRPEVAVTLVEDGGHALGKRVEQGDVHLALSIPHPGLRFRLLFPGWILAVVAPSHRLARTKTVELSDLAEEPLLALRPEFGSRQILDAAFRIAHRRPDVVLESAVPHTLVALAQSGYGTAIVPSNLRIDRKQVSAAPIVQDGKSIGFWTVVSWHPRRFLPPYAETFVEELVAFASRSHPGREFRYAPGVAHPEERGTGGKRTALRRHRETA